MLTRLRFKNWRSLRDETIEFSPITVFIGANSSGKTNIVDALRFHRDSLRKGLVEVVNELGYAKIQTDSAITEGRVELEFTYQIRDKTPELIREILVLEFEKRTIPFKYGQILYEGDVLLQSEDLQELPRRQNDFTVHTFAATERYERSRELRRYLTGVVQKRWQILSDSFVPPLQLTSHEGGSPYMVEPDARNLLPMLNFMRQSFPDLYESIQNDLRWILRHVEKLDVSQRREEGELTLLVRESEGRTAPTVSTGTARLIAMLTAFYALDMPQDWSYFTETHISPEMPGLVVIEEPDTALNPGILRNFVEQLRYFTTGEHPRQVILTTHNPVFLDYFEPEEVRVVTRDDNGYTSVQPIPESVKEIWLDEYALGEVWRTNSFGGLP